MQKLRNPQLQIPGGCVFYIPELKWQGRQGSSIDSLAQQAITALKGNPIVARRLGWDLSVPAMTQRVEDFQVRVCLHMGWTDYVSDVNPPAPTLEAANFPKTQPPNQGAQSENDLRAVVDKARALVKGARTLKEWIESNDPPVAPELSLHRAAICAACTKNESGDWTTWFTVPAAELIKRLIERAHERKLHTLLDDKLHRCAVCDCPMKLKVHIPIDWIRKHQSEREAAALAKVPGCWIAGEKK